MTMAELGGEHLKGFDKVSAHVCMYPAMLVTE